MKLSAVVGRKGLRKDRSWILTLVIALVLLAAWVSAIAVVLSFRKPDEHIPYDPKGWHASMTDAEGYYTGTRLKMVGMTC